MRTTTKRPTAAQSHKRADIQGLRAIAVLLVVAFHGGLHVPGGFTGVDVFFAISGFVITQSLASELASSGRIALGRFYGRRVRRLLPALALMVSVVALLGVVLSPIEEQHSEALTGVAASIFAANAYLFHLPTGYFALSTTVDPFLHTWTLAVEEQFYLVFPTILFLVWRLGRRRNDQTRSVVALAAVGVVSALSLLLSIATSYGRTVPGLSSPQAFAFYSSPTRAWEFGAGAMLALGSPWLRRVVPRVADLLVLGGIALIIVGAFAIHGTSHFPGIVALIPVGGACLAIAGGMSGGLPTRALGTPVLAWIGDLSYSWYLWHWPMIVDAKALWPGAGWAAPAAAGLSLFPAWLSYRFVENPLRFRRGFGGRAIVVMAAICVAVPIVACVGLVAANHELQHVRSLHTLALSQETHADLDRGCDNPAPFGDPSRPSSCTWTVPHARGTIVLIGDSNAGQFTEPVVAAGNEAGYDVTVATYSGCPFVQLRVVVVDPTAVCLRFATRSLAALVRAAPSLVITADRTDLYVGRPTTGLAPPSAGRMTYSDPAKVALWQHGLTTELRRLNTAGIPALLVHPVPEVNSPPSECAVLRVLFDVCSGSNSRASVDRELASSRSAEDAAVAAVRRTTTLEFENDICTTSICSAVRHGTFMYRDPEHLSVVGALTLTDRFLAAIRSALPRETS